MALITLSCVPKHSRKSPIPEEHHEESTVWGFSLIRNWGDHQPVYYGLSDNNDAQSVILSRTNQFTNWKEKDLSFLALSGGGPHGAYGAGFLSGWTKAGTRPEFQIVTGISTGSLIAPFAFLGSEYDSYIEEFYTTYSTDDLLKRRPVISLAASDAVFKSDGLKGAIDHYFTRDIMLKIEEEYRKGRVLLIGTSDIDALRPVIWNIGRIASFKTEEALELIRKIIYASASIPVAFPPVPIEVESNGHKYQELHVDGGITSQVFLLPAQIDWQMIKESLNLKSDPKLYIICNDRLDPTWQYTTTRLGDIALKSILSMIRTQTLGDLYRLYLQSEQNNYDYHYTYVPESFNEQSKELFDTEYMKKLFEVGYQIGLTQSGWQTTPPNFAQ